MTASRLRSWGSSTLGEGTKNRNGYLAHMWANGLHHPYPVGGPQRSTREQKTEMATWATCGQRGYITLAVSKVPNGQQGVPKQKWLPGPHVGKEATSPLPSRRSPMVNKGSQNRNGYLGHMWAKRLHHPCRLEGPQWSTRGPKTEMATWPTCKQSGYITPGVLGVLKPSTRGRKSAMAT